MAVYVDELRVWAHARGRYRAGSCHLIADSVPELHAFAAACGFKRSWYHSGASVPHYDLVSAGRDIAVAAGAVEIDWREFVRIGRRLKSRAPAT